MSSDCCSVTSSHANALEVSMHHSNKEHKYTVEHDDNTWLLSKSIGLMALIHLLRWNTSTKDIRMR